MDSRILGRDLKVSAIGLGCMGFSHAYGAPTEGREAVRAIRAVFDLGYTLFDTAEVYGTQADPHANERLVGEALEGIRDRVQIVSKFGIRFDMSSPAVNKPLIPDARPERIRENAGAAEVILSPEEVAAIDKALDTIPMSAVFGGTAVKSR